MTLLWKYQCQDWWPLERWCGERREERGHTISEFPAIVLSCHNGNNQTSHNTLHSPGIINTGISKTTLCTAQGSSTQGSAEQLCTAAPQWPREYNQRDQQHVTLHSRTTLCTAQGSLTQGSAEQHFARQNVEPGTKTRGSQVSESVDNCLECLQDLISY